MTPIRVICEPTAEVNQRKFWTQILEFRWIAAQYRRKTHIYHRHAQWQWSVIWRFQKQQRPTIESHHRLKQHIPATPGSLRGPLERVPCHIIKIPTQNKKRSSWSTSCLKDRSCRAKAVPWFHSKFDSASSRSSNRWQAQRLGTRRCLEARTRPRT